MRALSLLCFFLTVFQPIFASETKVLSILQPVADAALQGDFSAAVVVMYDPVAKDFGGKAEALAAAKGVQAQLEANNLKITRFDLVKPVRFVKSPVRQYVIVKTILEMEAPKVTMRSHGYQFGIEVSVGEWQFLDGSKLNKDIMAKYFPDFPKNEKLPELRKEML